MNEIQVFNNEQFGEVRTVMQNGAPWFVAADVCECLEIDRTQTRRLDEDEKGVYSIQTPGGEQDMSIVNEPGLYSLILGSRKPEAKAFKRWITHDVIPSIRKHGGYIAGQEALTDMELMAKALLVSQKVIAEREARLSEATVALQIAAPKAEYFDALVDRNLLTNFRETAKQLHIKEREFVQFLLEKKFCYRDKRGKIMPYAQHVEDGLFEIKECFNEKTQWSGTQTLVTPKGRETFRLLSIGAA